MSRGRRSSTCPMPLFAVMAPRLYEIANVDAFEWLGQAKPCSIHAVVTDPPYGLVEYTARELQKMQNGRGGSRRRSPSRT